MFSRFGLRSRMAVSYVLVSAAAVLVVEATLLAITVPRILSADRSAAQADQRAAQARDDTLTYKTHGLAAGVAAAASKDASTAASADPGRSAEALLAEVAPRAIEEAMPPAQERTNQPTDYLVLVLATADGRVIASNPASAFARGSRLPADAIGPPPRGGRTSMNGQAFGWATSPVEITDRSGTRLLGVAYAMVRREGDPRKVTDGAAASARISSLVLPAVTILGLLLPVGALFGLLSTRRLVRRISRLVERTAAMADGDLQARIPVSGGDELGRLERAVNSMAEGLDTARRAERKVASSEARQAERTRIARELHDAISQDLFSAAMLAGGLRKALPADSDLRPPAESLERFLVRSMQEMRAMLLELRPVALEEAGLAEALDQLCQTYRTRLGIPIAARIDPPQLAAPVEHAVLRVVQEALGNAVRHGEPGAIQLRVSAIDGQVAVTIHDDGSGFDPRQTAERRGMGLALMRERVGELGGTLDVTSAPHQGTTVTVRLPAGTP
jgi:signal transduction histidine kinase